MKETRAVKKWINQIDSNILWIDDQGYTQPDSKPDPKVKVVFKGKKADMIMKESEVEKLDARFKIKPVIVLETEKD